MSPQRPASASTMRRRMPRRAGRKPTTKPIASISTMPRLQVEPPIGWEIHASAATGIDGRQQHLREQKAEHAAEHDQQHGFGEHEAKHALVGKTNRLQHRELRNALAHGLRHRVAGEQDQREEHSRDDGADDQADVAELLDERKIERLLGLRLGFVIGIRGQRIDRGRDSLRILRIVYAREVPADRAAAERAAFVEIVPAEQHLVFEAALLLLAGLEDADDVERPCRVAARLVREDRTLDRDLVADLDVERARRRLPMTAPVRVSLNALR